MWVLLSLLRNSLLLRERSASSMLVPFPTAPGMYPRIYYSLSSLKVSRRMATELVILFCQPLPLWDPSLPKIFSKTPCFLPPSMGQGLPQVKGKKKKKGVFVNPGCTGQRQRQGLAPDRDTRNSQTLPRTFLSTPSVHGIVTIITLSTRIIYLSVPKHWTNGNASLQCLQSHKRKYSSVN